MTTRPKVVLTVGKLDGVHAGHRHLVARVLEEADRRAAVPCALVLHPDPATVLHGRPVTMLTTVDERARRLRALGLQIVEPLHFTPDVAELGPRAFLDWVAQRFTLEAMVVGPDFAFGRDRAGDLATLLALGRDRGFDVAVVPPLEATGEWVSSRRIRALVEAGDVETARTLLRAPPRVVGTVVHGAARGRSLGFPTANLDPSADFAMPRNGIYTVRASWGAERVDGVASVGVRPTFDNGARLVEVHLLDFDGDLYGREMAVDFLARQRDEHRYDTVEALIEQMHRDVAQARARLGGEERFGVTREDDGRIAVRGLDLADVCQRAAGTHRPGDAPPAGSLRHAHVSVPGSGEAAVLRAWVERARGAPADGALADAHVYYAGPRILHALVRTRREGAGDARPPSPVGLVSYAPADVGMVAILDDAAAMERDG